MEGGKQRAPSAKIPHESEQSGADRIERVQERYNIECAVDFEKGGEKYPNDDAE